MVIATPISLGLSLAPKTSRRHQTWEWRSDRHLLFTAVYTPPVEHGT